MPLPKLMLEAAQAGYSGTPGVTFKQAQLGGGRSRFRLDSGAATATVSVQWDCSPIQWQYLQAFVRSAIATGALDFLCDLLFDDASVDEYQVHLLPGTFALTGVRGMLHTARAQVELIPKPVNTTADLAVIDLYGAYGEEASNVLKRLAKLVNEDFTVLS
jgi:hypothetical protein